MSEEDHAHDIFLGWLQSQEADSQPELTFRQWLQTEPDGLAKSIGMNVYGKSDVVTLARAHSIVEESDIIALWEQLEILGGQYVTYGAYIQETPSPKEDRSHLLDVIKKIEELRIVLDPWKRGPSVSRGIQFSIDHIEIDLWQEHQKSEETLRMAAEKSGSNYEYMASGSVRSAMKELDFLQNVCSRALAEIGEIPKGPGTPDHLVYWIHGIGEFWSTQLARAITVDFYKTEPVSPFARFVCDCMTPLDPKTLAAGARPSLPSQLKKYRTARNSAPQRPHSSND